MSRSKDTISQDFIARNTYLKNVDIKFESFPVLKFLDVCYHMGSYKRVFF